MDALGINLSGLITQLISFTVLFLILRKLLFGPIGTMLQTRSEKIKESFDPKRVFNPGKMYRGI